METPQRDQAKGCRASWQPTGRCSGGHPRSHSTACTSLDSATADQNPLQTNLSQKEKSLFYKLEKLNSQGVVSGKVARGLQDISRLSSHSLAPCWLCLPQDGERLEVALRSLPPIPSSLPQTAKEVVRTPAHHFGSALAPTGSFSLHVRPAGLGVGGGSVQGTECGQG